MQWMLLLVAFIGSGCQNFSARVDSAQVLMHEDGKLKRLWNIVVETKGGFWGPAYTSVLREDIPSDLRDGRILREIIQQTPVLHNPGALAIIAQKITDGQLHREDYVIIGTRPFLIALRGSPKMGIPKRWFQNYS